MKTYLAAPAAILASALLFAPNPPPASADGKLLAWDIPATAEGNHVIEEGLGIANDISVIKPITVWSLGVFDHKGDGIQGSTILRVNLYSSNPNRARKRASGVLLETISFDAADPGELIGGFRYKTLVRPITLIPGQYTITADGFDEQNPDYMHLNDSVKRQTKSHVQLNNGPGLIRYEGASLYHVGYFLKRTRTAKDTEAVERAPDRYAAGSIAYLPATVPVSPFASDYSALTAGVRSFELDTNQPAGYSEYFGSIALLEDSTFPVIMEPSGSRLVFESAGKYNGDPAGARCVAFAHEQWGHNFKDSRAVLYENAIKWVGRKIKPSNIVVGLSTNIDAHYFLSRGYQVRLIGSEVRQGEVDPMSECDVVAVDFRGSHSEQFMARLMNYTVGGGGLVATFVPRRTSGGEIEPMFGPVNTLLQPFGLAYRSSSTQPNDFGFTNIQNQAYPLGLFTAYSAADLLHQDRIGTAHLDSLAKIIAVNTLFYAVDGRPDLLANLAAVYLGSAVDGAGNQAAPGAADFQDVLFLAGAQANTNYLGNWEPLGPQLASMESRGGVEYDINLPKANVYRIQIFGSEEGAQTNRNDFDLQVSIDGIPLGQYGFRMPYGAGTLLSIFYSKLGLRDIAVAYEASDRIECLTPYLAAGPHKLRVFWNNPNVQTRLRLTSVHFQSAISPDDNGDGFADWTQSLINTQSGLDITNQTLTSQVSPMSLEGRDPFPALIQAEVADADRNAPHLTPKPGPNGRWYVDVPLASQGNTTFHVSYQNGAKSEIRQIQWVPINVLDGGTYTVRDSDTLLLVARPYEAESEGTSEFIIETNRFAIKASAQMPYLFTGLRKVVAGGIYGSQTLSIKGVYTSKAGVSKEGTITVNVVRHEFKNNPACWTGHEREWPLTLPAGASFETDQRLSVESITQLKNGGVLTGLTIDQSEPRYFLSRLGTNGPVLSSGVAQGFDFWWAKDTYLRILKTLPDGSSVMEMMLVINPVLPNVTVQLDVLVGGVMFEDGTINKQLTRSDFDAQGKCVLRFIRPATFKPSVCHSITLLQDGAIVGRIW